MVDAVRTWLEAHEQMSDLVSAWTVCICFAVLGLVDVSSWAVIRATRDRTGIGVWLKYKKLAVGLAELTMAAIYATVLGAHYLGMTIDPAVVVLLRGVVSLMLAIGAVVGVAFLICLIGERRRRNAPEYPDMIAGSGG